MTIHGYKLSNEAARVAAGLPAREPRAAPHSVSLSAVALSNAGRVDPKWSPLAMNSKSIFAPLKFPKEVYGDNPIAMDSAPVACGPGLASWASQALFHEGQGFFGYPYLAELFQRSEYRNACEIWAEHAVRKWITFVNVDDDKKTKLEAAFKRLRVRDVIYRWCVQDHQYGRGQIFLDFGDANDTVELALPLLVDGRKINPKRALQRLTIVEPMWCAPGFYVSDNPLSGDFYKPTEWFCYGRKVAANRLLTLASRPVSDMLKPAYAFGGQALTQIMKPYVDNWLRARQSSSDLLDAHSQPVLSTDMSAIWAGGAGDDFYRRIDMMQNTRNNRGVMALDKATEEFAFVTTPLSGVSDLVGQALEQVCVAARIPQSIYLQNQPTGLNANSEGEVRGFYTDVHGYQEKNLRPGLKVIFDIVQLSEFGEIDPEADFIFNALWEMTDKDKADITKSRAEADATYIDRGVVSPDEVRERLAEEEEGLYAGVDLTGPAPEMPTDPNEADAGNNQPGDAGDPIHVGDSDWDESKHPRADNGQFGSGGGGAAPANSEPTATPKASAWRKDGSVTHFETGSEPRGFIQKRSNGNHVGFIAGTNGRNDRVLENLGDNPKKAKEAFEKALAEYDRPAALAKAKSEEDRQPSPKVVATLGEAGVEKLKKLLADPNSKAADILDVLEPLDAESASRTPTIAEGVEPDVDFWAKRRYDLDGKPGGRTGGYVEAIDALRDKAISYASDKGGVGLKHDRQARILLGPPAAGKSTSAEQIARKSGYAIVDGDDAKKIIPEFEGGIGASATQEESSMMGARVLKSMTDEGANVILPLVGAKVGSIEKRVKALQAAGYSVTVELVDVSQDNAVRRMGSRALYSGRHISSSYARSIGNGPLETYEALKQKYPDLGFGRIEGNGGYKEEHYLEAINHPDSVAGKALFG